MATAFEDALEKMLPVLIAIPKDELKKLDMPSAAVAQDALYTYKWCLADKSMLVARKLEWKMVENIPVLVMAFEEAQSNWNNVRFGREETMKMWMKVSPYGYELRDTLLHEYNYAYESYPEYQTRVQAVAEGTGDADMIQDLNDLVVVGRENSVPLTDTGFDFTLIDKAATLCEELGNLRAEASVDKAAYREKKLIRDQAYTHLMKVVGKVRQCGQFVFWKDEERRSGYVSQYKKKFRKSASQNTEPDVTEALFEPIDTETPPNTDTKYA